MVASVLKRRDTGFLLSAGGEPEDCGRGQRPGGRLRLACQADFGPVVAFTAPGAVPLNLVNFVAPAVCDFSIGPRPKVCPMIAAFPARLPARPPPPAGGGETIRALCGAVSPPTTYAHAGIVGLSGWFNSHKMTWNVVCVPGRKSMSKKSPSTPTTRRKFLAGAAVATAATVAAPSVVRAQGPVNMRWQSTWPSKDIFHEYALD